MIYRSTNNAFTHFSGDVTSNVDSSHGVQLTGGSTGGVVQPVGDDTDITLVLKGKGAGAVRVDSPIQSSAASTLAMATISTLALTQNAAVGSTAAAAALGNIGGAAGPTAQAQVGWIRILESSGGAAFVPYWK